MPRVKYATEVLEPRFSETVLSELNRDYSRSGALVTVETPLPFGLVLARSASGDKYEPYKGGDQKACAVLLTPLTEKGDQSALILVGYAILNENRLVWDSTADQARGLRQLEESGFRLRRVALPPEETEEPEEADAPEGTSETAKKQEASAPAVNSPEASKQEGGEGDNGAAQ